ncbi:MAG: hypothetical protein HY314_17650 [Acidobacteria bacterium]|nr:hypothetical protein [Acidobacteriota bacterium]
MEQSATASLKEHLLATNDEYRELARQHQEFEARLSELTSLSYPTEEEILEESLLKKKKLLLKDKMEAIMSRYKRQVVGK